MLKLQPHILSDEDKQTHKHTYTQKTYIQSKKNAFLQTQLLNCGTTFECFMSVSQLE